MTIHQRHTRPASSAAARALFPHRPRAVLDPPPYVDPAELPEIYGLEIGGDYMAPAACAGDFLAFSTVQRPEAGDLVALYLHPEAVTPCGSALYLMRLLVPAPDWVTWPWRADRPGNARAAVVVEISNPQTTWSVACIDLLALHRQVGVVQQRPAARRLGRRHAPGAQVAQAVSS